MLALGADRIRSHNAVSIHLSCKRQYLLVEVIVPVGLNTRSLLLDGWLDVQRGLNDLPVSEIRSLRVLGSKVCVGGRQHGLAYLITFSVFIAGLAYDFA